MVSYQWEHGAFFAYIFVVLPSVKLYGFYQPIMSVQA